jgi:AraC family transcriptional regulator, regulatory protein of adaptative response / methylphosphotriester-DNA alkyltransferase methyltransferase
MYAVMDMQGPRLRPSTVSARGAIFDNTMAIIRERYRDDLQIDPIAAELFTSRRQVQRVFNASEYGSFRNALLSVRMEVASELLRQNGTTVRQVANAVGYRQPAQFAKAFRRHHGVSPSEFRAGTLHTS